jgi:membrane protein DedA with SNARE-associated domain
MFGIAGFPLPDELLLTLFGVVAYKGQFGMSFWPILLVAWAGSSCGITVSYMIGRTAGLGVVHKWGKFLHVTPDKLDRVHEWYVHKKGRWALMFCIFAPVWRHLTAIIAGTSKMPFWEFAVCAYSGTLLWVSAFVTLGFLGGKAFEETSDTVHDVLLALSILAGVGVLAYFVWRNRRDARRSATAAALAGHCGDVDRSDVAAPSGKTDSNSNKSGE